MDLTINFGSQWNELVVELFNIYPVHGEPVSHVDYDGFLFVSTQ
jgi:hypothetical protein